MNRSHAKARPIAPHLNACANMTVSQSAAVNNLVAPTVAPPNIIARLHSLVRAQQSLNTTLDDFRCRISGEPQQEQNAQADLPPQPIEHLLMQIEQITGDNHGRLIDLMSRF